MTPEETVRAILDAYRRQDLAAAEALLADELVFTSPQGDGPLSASLDWRRSEGEEWTIAITTTDGNTVRLENGGSRLTVDGTASEDDGPGEYPDIYRQFVDLIDERKSLVDVAPLRLVADCLLVGSKKTVDAFNG